MPPPKTATRLAGLTLLLAVASLLAGGLQLVRHHQTGEASFAFLWWNLFLAWVPFVVSLVMVALDATRVRGWALLLPGVVWLLFLPNAPYILTDLIHVGAIPGAPLWFDAAMIAAFAAVGLALGLASLLLVHHIVAARLGTLAGWVMALGALGLSSVGIYLGRFPRFNSWDVLTDLEGLVGLVLARLADPLGNPFLLTFVGVTSAGLVGSYLVTWLLGRAVLPETGAPGAAPSGSPLR